jgi:hypothetical protein
MKSYKNIGAVSVGNNLLADDILEFHASRIILLIKYCGISNRIDGLTKLAKLDFFVRYPQFFNVLCNKMNTNKKSKTSSVESSMIRFHYGPWDKRYYQILSYLEAKDIITVDKQKNHFVFKLTESGQGIVNKLDKESSYIGLISQMKQVKDVLGNKAGSTIKKLIYEIFSEEITNKNIGDIIK